MTRINNLTVYNKDTNLTGEEYLIGSDTDDFGRTKNYQLKDIARYTFEDSDIEGIDQNNRVILFDMGDMENYPNGVSEALNSLPEYRISDKEILIVDSFKSFYEPPTFAQHNNFYKNNPPLKIINYRHIFKLGKGYYGIPDENHTKLIHPEDLILLNSSEESLPSETGKKPILYTILNADGKTSHQAINEDSVFEIENGTDVYFNIHRKGLKMTYRFIGDPGTYGIGETQVEASDLLLMDKDELSLTAINDISVREIAPIFIPNSSTKADVVNTMPPINKSKGEITVFNFRQWKEEGVAARLELSSWLFKRNQGKYGNPDEGGVPVSNADFILISKIYSQSSGLSNSNYVNFDLSEEQNLVDAINNNEELIELSSDTTTLVERNKDVYELTGEEGLYGKGHLQISEGNLSLLEMDAPSSGGGIYQGASPTTRTVGGLNSGTNILGKTYDELFEAMLAEYVAPSISSFSMEGQNSPIEVGTVISGNKNFSFGFSQSGNVANNTIKIIDVTDDNNVLASGLSKSSPQSVNVGSVSKTTATDNVWRIEAESTKGATIARNMSIQWQYRYFFGGSATDITNSSQVRALATSALDSGGTNNVNVTAGTAHTEFYFFVQNGRKIDTVIDTSALNADITSAYVLVGTITVNDNGGNSQTYKKYKLTLAGAYETPHVHRITIKNN